MEFEDKLNELHEIIKREFSDTCTSVHVTFTGYGWDFTTTNKSPQSLKNNNQSMKNVKGQWIK